jgi:tetratricopeptide (TPR) repeat protein
MIKKLLILISYIFLISNSLLAKNLYFEEGINLFKDKKFQEAKFKFEQEIVLNPKSEISYLYLSKIFKQLDKKQLQENNLNTVILLNPNNEEANFNLARLKLENSDYKKSKEINDKLSTFCKKFCVESKRLKIEIENLSKK